MKNFKRLVAGTIAATMALALSVSAFAEVEVTSEDNITYASAAATYGNTITAKDGTQMTVVIFDATKELSNLKGEDLLYINQDEKGKLSLTSMGTKIDLLEANEDGSAKYAGEYVIRVGYYDTEGNWKVAEGNFTVATKAAEDTTKKVTILHGDVTADNAVNISDAGAVVRYVLGVAEKFTHANGDVFEMNKTYDTVLWGDTTLDGAVNISDAGALVRKVLGVAEEFGNNNVKMEDPIEIELPITK